MKYSLTLLLSCCCLAALLLPCCPFAVLLRSCCPTALLEAPPPPPATKSIFFIPNFTQHDEFCFFPELLPSQFHLELLGKYSGEGFSLANFFSVSFPFHWSFPWSCSFEFPSQAFRNASQTLSKGIRRKSPRKGKERERRHRGKFCQAEILTRILPKQF